jgi:hypothetical protein
MLMQKRWFIESGFHELAGELDLDRAYVHDGRPNATVAIVGLAFMANNALQAFLYRAIGLTPGRTERTPRRSLGRQWPTSHAWAHGEDPRRHLQRLLGEPGRSTEPEGRRSWSVRSWPPHARPAPHNPRPQFAARPPGGILELPTEQPPGSPPLDPTASRANRAGHRAQSEISGCSRRLNLQITSG